ncbi:PREDICTED: signal peptidase complex subunit 1-like [Branchiostoma belcheri]|uniref:Signal peptidase complex subunit 1 n=1 Tax=Branchiostoma belcheri TaxID=7741 RepID=A0A6P4Z914_BRABE|nr:PREDICTED: signal peptidase complex subunit 1-like [Branchiostoma belcheri]KAI8517317.1 Signal peptidase complex subunit 1 [Branchiostoma belcheri]
MEAIKEKLNAIPSHMDYKGQKLAEQIFQIIIVVFAVVGFAWGYVCEQFVQTVYILVAGFILSCLLTLPPWPIYRRHPLPWQKPRDDSKEVSQKESKKSGGKKKEKSK